MLVLYEVLYVLVTLGALETLVSSFKAKHTDTNFKGFEYWNARCEMGYLDDWLGYWSRYTKRDEYRRSYDFYSCSSGCVCLGTELDCRSLTGNNLEVIQGNSHIIRNGYLPDSLQTIQIINAGITLIEEKVFYNLTDLTELNLGQNKLRAMPDVSMNKKLTKLILDHNEIEIFIQNVTSLPESLVELVLLGNKIKFIPDGMFNLPNLKRIALSKNQLTRFPNFQNTKNIEFISVDQNKIEVITSTSLEVFFGNNSQLKHLNFSNNVITSMPSRTLTNLIHLKILELHNNRISFIDNQVFYNIPELCHLDLRGNKLKVITGSGYSPAFEDLPNLKTLILTGQKATSIMYNAFKNLPKLEHLWLDQNELEHFPHPAFSHEEWPSIKELHIETNKFTTLSSYSNTDFPPYMMELWASLKTKNEPFATMKSLQYLSVHDNNMVKVEEGDLWQLNNLIKLYLSGNILTENSIDPEAFRNLTLLKTLHLDAMKGVGIQYVPAVTKEKDRLPQIQELDLSSNKLTFLLNGSFSSLDTLGTLQLRSNKIVSIETGAFPNSINSIGIQGNKFDFRHPDVFANLPSLTSLYLQNNQISSIPDNALYGLENLNTLNVQDNKIGRITKECFKDLKKLSSIDLSNNELSYIEEGTFTAIDRSSNPSIYVDISSNHLTLLPAKGDFSNIAIRYFYAQNNRLTRIRSGTFENAKCTNNYDWSFTGNNIVEIEENAFVNITGGGCDLFIGGSNENPLKKIAPRAFNNVAAKSISLDHLQLKTLRAETFKNVNLGSNKDNNYLNLESNLIESMEEDAFAGITVGSLYLQDNKIAAISGKIFGTGSHVTRLDLQRNNIKSLHEDSFKGVSISENLLLSNNKLVTFPGNALKSINTQSLDLAYNSIPSLPLGSLDNLTNLRYLNLGNNIIAKLEKGVFHKLTILNTIKLQDNIIKEIEEETFDNLNQLEKIYLQNNLIKNIPAFDNLLLRIINLEKNSLEMMGIMAFSKLPRLADLRLSDNPLSCGCNVYNSLHDVIQAVTSPATCQTPDRVRGVTFPGNYINAPRRDFTCSPVNLTSSAPRDFQLRVAWNSTKYSYPPTFRNATTNGTISGTIIVPDNYTTLNITYQVTCHGPANQTVQGVTNLTWFVFKKSDGILAGSNYRCFVQTIEVTRENGTNKVISRTSVDSHSILQTTIKGKAPVTNTTTNTSNYYLAITYYDFSMAQPDFVSGSYKGTYFNPKYIASPYGSWLSIPGNAKFSDWFRSHSARNIHYDEILQLSLTNELDGNGNPVYRYFSPEFFPVDGRGFKAEGQRDCTTNALRNFGFTVASRNTFNFTGQEVLTFAGGKELYVFINKQLLIEMFHDPSNTSTPCAVLELNDALKKGGGKIEWETGILVGTSCQNTKPSGQEVELDLLLGVPYRLDVFMAERFLCESTFLYQASGVSFVQPWQPTKAVDYLTTVPESLHVGAIVQEFLIGDEFYTGDYTLSVLLGNEQRRFTIEPMTYTPSNRVPVQENQTVIVENKRVVLCVNASNVTQPIPDVSSDVEIFDLSSSNALLVLNDTLDYEWTKEYNILIEVTDKDTRDKGNITIRVLVSDVNDNCPILPNVSYSFSPVPPLIKASFFIIKATDLDSGENSKISYVPERVAEWNLVSHISFNTANDTVWVNETIETTWAYRIYAVDNGNPRRGDFIRVNVTINATCTSRAKFVINGTTGEVFLRAPGLTGSEYHKPMCRRCRTSYYCPGDGTEMHCGNTSTVYSFGGASKCEKCPVGWLCHKGIALPCPPDTWVICNETFCPDKCNPCEPGTVCFNGNSTDCSPGTYSDGTGFPCKLCPPGSYNNISRATTCACCPAGYTSTYRKNGCRACHLREWATEGTFPRCGLCQTCGNAAQCPCTTSPSPCSPGVVCRNLGPGQYKCGDCPVGYEGNGSKCIDIDECSLASPCYDNTSCVNLSPGYRCGGCPAGHRGNAPSGIGLEQARSSQQACVDIDECEEGDHMCDVNSDCINTIGSYKCGACNPGYIGHGNSGCTPGDVCDTNVNDCHSNATCTSRGSGRYICTCKDGFAGDGRVCGPDDDQDGIPNKGLSCLEHHCQRDNCRSVPNEDQNDNDDDSEGDVCDTDDDNDNIKDEQDNCQYVFNPEQLDSDNDGVGDVCDNCNTTPNSDQSDIDGDKIGDKCDDDMDGDGILNTADNCVRVRNADQKDTDGDAIGDDCDNCPKIKNTNQDDTNQNGYGDVCDQPGSDRDGDSVNNHFDNCIDLPNAEQANKDGNLLGDVCDDDIDGDGVLNNNDNCPMVSNSKQEHNELIYDADRVAIGDNCNEDYDGDAVKDIDDSCPHVANIHQTSFTDHFIVSLAIGGQPGDSKWKIYNKGRDAQQFSNLSSPSLLVGQQRYGPVDFSGTLFVNTNEGLNYIGFVFGYQSNRKFYVVMWRHKNLNLDDNTYQAGIKGLQLKLVNSNTGPSNSLAQALWHSADTANQVSLLWHDPLMQGWEHQTAYRFYLQHRPSVGKIRLVVKEGEAILADSGDIYNTAITGGRLGLFVYGQDHVIWSRLLANCQDRENHALLFNGANDYVLLPTVKELQLTDSFTISTWIKMATSYPLSSMPAVCTLDTIICLFIEDKLLHGKYGSHTVSGNDVINDDDWHHVTIRYDAQRHELGIFLNGITHGKLTNIEPLQWVNDSTVYLGRDMTHYFKGEIDDVSFWPVKQSDTEVKEFAQMAGLSWPKHKRIVRAHYTMDQKMGTDLLDESGNKLNGKLQGKPRWVQSTLDKMRFQLTYPNNRKRRSLHELHTEL